MKRIKVLIICMLYLVSVMLVTVSCTVADNASTTEQSGEETNNGSVIEQNGEGKNNGSADEQIGFGPEPTITVFTEFPTGTVLTSRVDITYEAIPSKGAYITEISYSINNEDWVEFIYFAETDNEDLNKLGEGFIFLSSGENRNIVFTVTDSSGKTGQCVIENLPYWDTGYAPEIDSSKFLPAKEGGDRVYLPDMLFLMTKKDISYEEVEEMITSIDGKIVGRKYETYYYIQVPKSTEDELLEMCAKIEETYEEKISYIILYYGGGYTLDSTDYTNDPWWNEQPSDAEQIDSKGKTWALPNRQWGLDAIHAPDAWKIYAEKVDRSGKIKAGRGVKVGVIDNGFQITHVDLQDLNITVYGNNEKNVNDNKRNHGTHVMGTIAATHDNNKGISGVIDMEGSLYGYDVKIGGVINDVEVIIALRQLIGEERVKVINFSIGKTTAEDPKNYVDTLQELRDDGRDFVIVAAAGNDSQRAGISYFSAIEDKENNYDLKDRIIVVGAADPPYDPENPQIDPDKPVYTMAAYSNYGDRIDVVAPGTRIYSTVAFLRSTYGNAYYKMMDGTSMATPHVTGVAALVWAAKPSLTGDQVKKIIVDSAKESGTKVMEYREAVPIWDYYLVDAEAAVKKATMSPLAKPVLSSVTIESSTLLKDNNKLTWKVLEDATGYEIYRSTSLKGNFKKVKTITDGDVSSYTDSVFSFGYTYYYKICAVAGDLYSEFSNVKEVDGYQNYFNSLFSRLFGMSIENGKNTFGIAKTIRLSDPLIIDLDGTGIETLPLSQGVYFDHQGNGFMIKTGWVGPTSGLLVRDTNGNGKINSGRQLFGDNTLLKSGKLAANGFEALKDLDDNGDGVIDEEDATFSELFIWNDANSNGRVDAGELITLEEAGILSIDLAYRNINIVDSHGNNHRQISTVTKTDGTTVDVVDVWFVRDITDSDTEEKLSVSDELANLPNIRGFGTVHSLHQAMERDTTGQLKSLLEQFAAERSEIARRNLVLKILYKWSGANSNLSVLEAFIGEKYTGQINAINTPILNQAFDNLANKTYDILMAQTHYQYLYDEMALVGDDPDNMNFDLTDAAQSILSEINKNPDTGEDLLAHYMINMYNLTMLDYVDIDGFADIFAGENIAYGCVAGMVKKNLFVGTTGNDKITGTNADDAYFLEYGNNTIEGGYGNNTYFFAKNFGTNTICDKGGNNEIVFL